ncbi:MAG: 2-amino-4-hydroxy-6-hydroxymethyldihydropteridine diphosphokinase [Saprospiraceae bacterium]|nr:2-amino-4-hydroxy-6-hydroxymethyldihydropteridine diphosphokinase [Saprospiraceae bacterium]
MSKPVFLLLGSNMGASEKLLALAVVEIKKSCGVVESMSALYRSQAWGYEDQSDFVNQVVKIRTGLAPTDLLETILGIEKSLGRERDGRRWQSRLLDIDILFYDHQVIDLPDLKIPHPRIAERNFTLVPLMEIARDFLHPSLGATIEELYLQCADTLEVQKIEC